MIPRFFISNPPQGDQVDLTGGEAHHMIDVRRMVEGDRVTLFDNGGAEYAGVIERIIGGGAGLSVRIRVSERGQTDREPAVKIVIATAIPKGERADTMAQKCAELGCHTWIPLECARSVVRFVPGREGKLEKWRRVALEASKQCGRNRVMEVGEPCAFEALLKEGAKTPGLRLICALTPSARPLKNLLAEKGHPKDIICLVGPEGGFTDEEMTQAAAAGFIPVRLARSILRTETAAIAATAIIGAEYMP